MFAKCWKNLKLGTNKLKLDWKLLPKIFFRSNNIHREIDRWNRRRFGAKWNVTVPNSVTPVNTLRSRQNGRYFAVDIFKCIFVNENAWISLKISLKFVPLVRIDNIPALVRIMAWRRPGDKPLSEPMMVSLLTHICVTRPQWVKPIVCKWIYMSWGSAVKWHTNRTYIIFSSILSWNCDFEQFL